MRRLRVLVLSRTYPSPALPVHGLWVQRMVEAVASVASVSVVVPVPWVPPLLPLGPDRARYRRIPRVAREPWGSEVHYPRVPVPPGSAAQPLEARLFGPFVERLVRRLHRAHPFDLIHAHFIYPEGVIGARIGERLSLPVMTTEHSLWLPWLRDRQRVRRQVLAALPGIELVSVVSEAVGDSVRAIADGRARVAVLPNVLDDATFADGALEGERSPARVLFVGAIRRVKGFDVLVRALAALVPERPAVEVRVIGEAFFRQYARDEQAARRLAEELGVLDRLRFLGPLPPAAVAAEMRRSAVVVVPSRRESFSSVTIEALASGTPVVATRCGGPDEILPEWAGRLVPVEDPQALAEALRQVLEGWDTFDRARLRRHAVSTWGRSASQLRLQRTYEALLS